MLTACRSPTGSSTLAAVPHRRKPASAKVRPTLVRKTSDRPLYCQFIGPVQHWFTYTTISSYSMSSHTGGTHSLGLMHCTYFDSPPAHLSPFPTHTPLDYITHCLPFLITYCRPLSHDRHCTCIARAGRHSFFFGLPSLLPFAHWNGVHIDCIFPFSLTVYQNNTPGWTIGLRHHTTAWDTKRRFYRHKRRPGHGCFSLVWLF
jgi:hypothetical protein